jgi:hypothetical protein
MAPQCFPLLFYWQSGTLHQRIESANRLKLPFNTLKTVRTCRLGLIVMVKADDGIGLKTTALQRVMPARDKNDQGEHASRYANRCKAEMREYAGEDDDQDGEAIGGIDTSPQQRQQATNNKPCRGRQYRQRELPSK